MNRRKFVSLTLGGSAALALTNHCLRAQPIHPNVIFFFMDDMNDWLGCLGHSQALTPNIDAFADSGVNFTNAHANATACIPSRCSLFASRRPSSTGVYENDLDWPLRMPDSLWMPHNFSQNGYQIFRAGKFFHPAYNDVWDEHCSMNPTARPPNFPNNGFPFETSYFKRFDWAAVDVPDDSMRDGTYANWSIQKLQETHSAPFFLPIGFTSTHDPWYIPRRYFEPFPLESIELPEVPDDEWDDIPDFARNHYLNPVFHESVVKQQQWRKAVQAYLATIYYTDTLFGRVMDALEASPYLDETMVIFSSDHGLHLGEKLRWRKFALWQEDTRVPLIIRAPGITQPGGVHTHPTELLDIYPTMVDLCGLSPVPDAEGVPLTSRLLDPTLDPGRPAVITADYQCHAVVSDRYAYIIYTDGSEELYDHDTDPDEHINLAGDPAYQTIIDELAEWLPEVNVLP